MRFDICCVSIKHNGEKPKHYQKGAYGLDDICGGEAPNN